MHALPLCLRGRVIGVLSLFAGRPGPLPGSDLTLGRALADTAAVAILRDRSVRHTEDRAPRLQGALDGRVVVEQAKGFVSQHHGVDVDSAFRLLREEAGIRRLQILEVAHLVVMGDLDPGAMAARATPPSG